MDIRPATAADIPALHALIEGAYRGESARRGWTHEADLLGGQRTDVDALAAMLGESRQVILVAVAAGAIVGCVHVADKGDGVAYLGLLTVDPAAQAAGLGRGLIAAAERQAVALGARVMEMTVIRQRGELIAWYERRGYRPTGEERPFPLDDVRFGVAKTRELGFVVLEKRIATD